MDLNEARGKLRHYVQIYGHQILALTPEQALSQSEEFRRLQHLAVERNEFVEANRFATKAVQYVAVADCLKLCGTVPHLSGNVVALKSRSMADRQDSVLQQKELDSSTLMSAVELTRFIRHPMFRIGEKLWIESVMGESPTDDSSAEIGYVEAIVVAISWRHNDIRYLMGFLYNGDIVVSDDNMVEEEDLHRVIPAKPRERPALVHPHLTVVK